MYATAQHHQYVYSPAVPAPRQYSGTSSAFSSSANPDEDWTKISDLAERRRIQNRIAQRNYRKKLKRRLEDLERRAGTSDPAPAEKGQAQAQTGGKGHKRQPTAAKAPQKQQQHHQTSVSPRPVPTPQFTPPMNPDDEYMFPGATTGAYGVKRERSTTPPSLFHPYTYPPPEEQTFLTPYPAAAAHAYRPMTTTAASTTDAYPEYLATTVPVTLPGMTHFSDALKGDDSFMPYLNYGLVPGMDISGANPYDGANPHTPPLSHSFDHSANCSDAGYEYPHTPLSMPSPGMIQN